LDLEDEMMRLFGTAGMRGVTGVDMTPELFHRVARSAAAGILGGPGSALAVGRDTRPGAAMLAASAMAGAMEAGAGVRDAGVIPTPGLARYVVSAGLDGGLMVTGSHTPPDRIGLMVLRSDGSYIPDGTAERLEALLDGAPAGRDGPYGELVPAPEAVTGYRRWLLESVDLAAIRGRGFKVGVDAANGTAAGLVSGVLGAAWCRVSPVNDVCGPDPGRDPEPRATSLAELKRMVVDSGLDLGAAFDADADRVSFIDEKGGYASEDAVGALIGAYHLPERGGVIVTPVNSSGMAGHLAGSRGARLHHCRVGQPSIVEAVKARGAHFAYEESGKYYLTDLTLCSDGPLVCLKMLELLSASEEPLSEHLSRLPVYHQVKEKLRMGAGDLSRLMEEIGSRWEKWSPFPGAARDRTDGLKLTLEDGSWLLIRPSGTEPILRIYSDSRDGDRASGLVREGEAFVKDVMEGLGMEAEPERL